MPQSEPFVLHLAQLIWLLTHRPNQVNEQKAAMRCALSHTLARSQVISASDLNILVADAARQSPAPEELPWIRELALRMAGHSIRTLLFATGTMARDTLNLARALSEPPVVGDEGAAFSVRVETLSLQTINVRFEREGFVRRATPALDTVVVSDCTPPLGKRAVNSPSPPLGARIRLALGNQAPSDTLPPPFEDRRSGRIAAVHGMSASETAEIFESSLAATNVSRELEQVLAAIDAPMDANGAARQLQELTRSTEQRASEGLHVDVLAIMKQILRREDAEKNAGVRRAFVVAIRHLNQPGILRGIAQLLPRRRELRDDATFVLARYGETASDVLIELLVATDVATERRAYRVALTHCPSAVPALIHLLGDARWFVTRNAAELLGEMGVTEADGKLAQTMRHPDTRVRRAAATALARLGTPRALHALQQALTDKAPAVRLQSALGLGAIRNPRAVMPVIDALEKEDDPDVQAALLTALGSMPTAEAVGRLRRAAEPGSLLNRKPTSVRLHAIQALGDAGTHSAQTALRSLVADRDKEVQAKVARLLEDRTYATV